MRKMRTRRSGSSSSSQRQNGETSDDEETREKKREGVHCGQVREGGKTFGERRLLANYRKNQSKIIKEEDLTIVTTMKFLSPSDDDDGCHSSAISVRTLIDG